MSIHWLSELPRPVDSDILPVLLMFILISMDWMSLQLRWLRRQARAQPSPLRRPPLNAFERKGTRLPLYLCPHSSSLHQVFLMLLTRLAETSTYSDFLFLPSPTSYLPFRLAIPSSLFPASVPPITLLSSSAEEFGSCLILVGSVFFLKSRFFSIIVDVLQSSVMYHPSAGNTVVTCLCTAPNVINKITHIGSSEAERYLVY